MTTWCLGDPLLTASLLPPAAGPRRDEREQRGPVRGYNRHQAPPRPQQLHLRAALLAAPGPVAAQSGRPLILARLGGASPTRPERGCDPAVVGRRKREAGDGRPEAGRALADP